MSGINSTGFRANDCRWQWGDDIDKAGAARLGHCLAAFFKSKGHDRCLVARDAERGSAVLYMHLVLGMLQAGIHIIDLDTCTTPEVYFARKHHDTHAFVMCTASHNPDPWVGIKWGYEAGRTAQWHDNKQLEALCRDAVPATMIEGEKSLYVMAHGATHQAYLEFLLAHAPATSAKHLKILVLHNGSPVHRYAQRVLKHMGHVVYAHEYHEYRDPTTQAAIAAARHDMRSGTYDLCLMYDADGDRLGVMDSTATPVQPDIIGLLLARHSEPAKVYVADVKCSALLRMITHFNYVATGHSLIKAYMHRFPETDVAIERSGHFYFKEIGGHDDALFATIKLVQMLSEHASRPSLASLVHELPKRYSASVDVPAADREKGKAVYHLMMQVQDRMPPFQHDSITDIIKIDGVRVEYEGGSWWLARASNTGPHIVIVAESVVNERHAQDMCDGAARMLKEWLSASGSLVSDTSIL